MVAFIFIVLIASIIALIVFKRGETMRFETTAQPPQILMQANSEVGTKKRWTVVSQSPHNVVFAYQKGPNKLIALILLVFFLVPGIIYIMLAGKRESLNIMFDVRPDRLSQVQVTSNGYRGKLAGRSLRGALAASTPAAVADPAHHVPTPAVVAPHVQHPAPVTPQAQYPAVSAAHIHPAVTIAQPQALAPVEATAAIQAVQAPVTQHAAAWYPDPHYPGHQRYFDGHQWTEHRAPIA